MSTPFFRVPLNLPHAGTIASRIVYHLERLKHARPSGGSGGSGGSSDLGGFATALEQAHLLTETLAQYRLTGENPAENEAQAVIAGAAQLARRLVEEIERGKLGDDRLGQAVRNLFECFELGQEGAELSLRAGENPRSTLRPY